MACLAIPGAVSFILLLLYNINLIGCEALDQNKPININVNKEIYSDFDINEIVKRSKRSAEVVGKVAISEKSQLNNTNITISEHELEPTIEKFELNDAHHLIIIGWAGEGSNVIVCVTKDRQQTVNSTSNIYISYDYGSTYKNKTNEFKIDDTNFAIINKFYKNEKFTDRFVFADTINNYLFMTMDYGRTIIKQKLQFSPTEVLNHPSNAYTFLVFDSNDKYKKLWITTDFGESWRIISLYVKSYFWSNKNSDPILYVERAEPGIDSIVFSFQKFSSFGDFEQDVVLTGVKEFSVKEDYLFAVKAKQRLLGAKTSADDSLQLWISYKGGPFLLSVFPNKLIHQHYYFADISYGQIMVCVFHGMSSNLYVSSIPASSKAQIKFSLSLERIFYFNPNTNWNNTWLNDVADEPFADLHRVEGVRGIFIASQLSANYSKMSRKLGPQHLTSLITFDQGGQWRPIKAPLTNSEGISTKCYLKDNCSLHVSIEMTSYYPQAKTKPILSGKSAPGLIIASGTVGVSLKGHTGIFMSSDAGISWHQILRGNYLFTYGDHGAVLMAVEHYPFNSATKQVLYSTDEGETWHSHVFSEESIKVYGLMVEPGEGTKIFTIFGSLVDKHEWVLFKIDMTPVFKGKCSKRDYKEWTPYLVDSTKGLLCLLGRKDIYERRIPHSNCFNGENYNQLIKEETCLCTRGDYECDFAFITNENGKCVANDKNEVNPLEIPMGCKQGQFYNRTKGYRKVPGDICSGGDDTVYGPQLFPCPLEEEREFFLISSRTHIFRYDLLNPTKGLQALPLSGLEAAIALEFDLKSNCLFWSDVITKKIMRQCFDGEHEQEILVHTDIDSVEGLALDWISNNLYFVDGGQRKSIEAIALNSRHRWRTTILKSKPGDEIVLDMPRGIALHPIKGYLFFTDWSHTMPMVARSNLDGTNLKVLFGVGEVGWPNGITVDFKSERIYWADAKLDYIASSDIDGHNFQKVISNNDFVRQPFAVAIYKNMIFWDDWGRFQVYQADKEHGWAITPLSSKPIPSLVDLKVYGHFTQHGKNACGDKASNGTCQFFCMGTPASSFSCMCPDWMKESNSIDRAKTRCLCNDDSEPNELGACKAHNNTCGDKFFKCKSTNICIPDSMRCDNDNDCGDNSDEKHCPEMSCKAGSRRCANNDKCIPHSWFCDMDIDCEDKSDEKDCKYPKCSDTEFTCKNHRCIDQKWFCDLQDDCLDGSDESNCTFAGDKKGKESCRMSQFQCKSDKRCLPITWQCDGERDCIDNSDETNCDEHQCKEWQFQCSSKACIYKTWICDGENDCKDGIDELNCTQSENHNTVTPKPIIPINKNVTCSPFEFRCTDGSCIHYWWRCDKTNDCSDGLDEVGCSNTTSSFLPSFPSSTPFPCREDQMQCLNRDCIWLSWICDGDRDCSEGEDEKDCKNRVNCTSTQFRCFHSGGCIEGSERCDGTPNCADSSDELGCTVLAPNLPKRCDEGFFSCDGGTCLPQYKKCDTNYDCQDMSDEYNCTNQNVVYQANNLKVLMISNTSLAFSWQLIFNKSLDLEVMGSYIKKEDYHRDSKNVWNNGTWADTSTKMWTFSKLKPNTDYILRVYVREKSSGKEFPPGQTLQVKTAVGIPSAPYNLKVSQLQQRIKLEWSEPRDPNGDLRAYRIYISDNSPSIPQIFTIDAPKTVFVYSGPEQRKYTLWLTASNSEYTSVSSDKITFQLVDLVINKLHTMFKNISNVGLKWDPIAHIEGYVVSYTSPIQLFSSVKIKINCTQSNILVSNLSPGMKYRFEVQGFNGSALGAPTTTQVIVPGDKLPHVIKSHGESQIINGTDITITWGKPSYKLEYMWNYGIVWGKTINDLARRIHVGTTTNTSFVIRNLDACEFIYIVVMISGPIGEGPVKQFHIMTGENVLAPPKYLQVHQDAGMMRLSWQPPCPPSLDKSFNYLINVTEFNRGKTFMFEVPPMADKVRQHHSFQMHDGGNYSVIVRTALKNSRSTSSAFVLGNPIPAPYELIFNPNDSSFFWQYKSVTKKHSFVVYLRRTGRNDSTIEMEVDDPPYQSLKMEPGLIYVASVSFKDSDGYLSAESQGIRVEKNIGEGEILISQTSMVGMVVAVVVALSTLMVVVVLLVVRHRRLASSFSSFANSHYDRFQGTVTTDHNLDEDDSPIIRGFSDDEPLVMA